MLNAAYATLRIDELLLRQHAELISLFLCALVLRYIKEILLAVDDIA